jgi:thioredoxin-like negative regulator of GroEL
MLKDVIQRDPKAVNARLSLAKVYAQRGRHEDAIAMATEALQFAEDAHRDDLIPDAQATVAKVQALNQASLSPQP